MLCYQLILTGKIAFGKTQVMNGIQQISFTHTVKAANAYNTFGKQLLLAKVIFKLK